MLKILAKALSLAIDKVSLAVTSGPNISKDFVKTHRGTIRVESEVGKGSTNY